MADIISAALFILVLGWALFMVAKHMSRSARLRRPISRASIQQAVHEEDGDRPRGAME